MGHFQFIYEPKVLTNDTAKVAHKRIIDKIYETISKGGENGMRARQIYQNSNLFKQSVSYKLMHDIISDLVANGELEATKDGRTLSYHI